MARDATPEINQQSLARADGLVIVLNTPKGRGIFASKAVTKGTIVDVSPVLVFTEQEVEKHTRYTCLQHYTYYWPSSNGKSSTQAIALGLGSMFNHSNARQNVTWTRDLRAQCIVYTAFRDIAAGEELCISYGSGRLWFRDADADAGAVDADDEWSRIQARRGMNGDAESEIEISGIGSIEL